MGELILKAISSMVGEIAVTGIGTVNDRELNESRCLDWLSCHRRRRIVLINYLGEYIREARPDSSID